MSERRLLVIGGGFAGLCVARDMKDHMLTTVVDAKEYFEYTPGILRAYVKPKHLDALTFTLKPVLEESMGCKFVWGEVTKLQPRVATVNPIFSKKEEEIEFDYCVIASGCNFGVLHKYGESHWFPTVHEIGRANSDWAHIDERFLEGRRRHILEEYNYLKDLNERKEKQGIILVVGGGFIGVEWVTELQYFFPNLKLFLAEMMDYILGPLPDSARKYVNRYLDKKKIEVKVGKGYGREGFWPALGLPENGADKVYFCLGVKASNYFMPDNTKCPRGWVKVDQRLAVKDTEDKPWSVDDKNYPRVFAIGDCNLTPITNIVKDEQGNLTKDEKGEYVTELAVHMIPKISYPGEEEAVVVLKNIEKIDKLYYKKQTVTTCGHKIELHNIHWPWGAGMFATSLGPHDACFVAGANWNKFSGYTLLKGCLSAIQKEVIECSKVNECKNRNTGFLIWYFVHHTPVHLFGGGPFWGY